MNKELIKKYKTEFDHWLNGGKVISKYTLIPTWSNCQSEDIWRIPDKNISKVLIVINDEYATYRKALAEGKSIQMLCRYDKMEPIWDDMTEVIKSIGFVDVKENYRIKPEEPKFKVGDWVRDLRDNSVFQINSVNFNLNLSITNGVYIRWQPKPGEWCWFSIKNRIPTIGQFLTIETDSNKKYSATFPNTPHPFISYYDYCEPFLGQLPTKLKEPLC